MTSETWKSSTLLKKIFSNLFFLHCLLQSPISLLTQTQLPVPFSPIMSIFRPNICKVLSETSRVISDHSCHFLVLSVLFLFPISFATIMYPVGKSQFQIPVLYILFVLLFNLCAVPYITHSTFRGYCDRPVRFVSSLKSILVSFFPLLATVLVILIFLGLIVFAFGIFVLLAYIGLALLGHKIDHDSEYFLGFFILIVVLLVGLLIHLQVKWYLTTAIVVMESQWGFAPLKRSSYLVKGMSGVVFLMILLFGILFGLLSIWYSSLVARTSEGSLTGWVVVQMVVYAGFCTILSLYSVAANTILFVYCKELHEESEFQSDEEFDWDYDRLPF